MSAIPTLTRAHINKALAQIDREGVRPRRNSTRYHLVKGSKRYPPKYVISLATYQATGSELDPEQFSGGEEANNVLISLGFEIVGPSGRKVKPKQSLAIIESRSRRTFEPTLVTDSVIVRIVVKGRPASSPKAAEEMLIEAMGPLWPQISNAKFVITPGGFLSCEFPPKWRGGKSWDSTSVDLSQLVKAAKPVVESVLSGKVRELAKSRARVLTIGIDLWGNSEQAELVAVFDCISGKIVRWTGKSYPVGEQEKSLVQITDLSSHLLDIDGERVLVLGCHDLNMFSPRARANQVPFGNRWKRCESMTKLVKRFRPTIVLQHPHSTDTPNIWRMPWASLVRQFPTVRFYASGIAYFVWNGRPRRSLQEVLAGTKSCDAVADIIVKTR